MTENTTDTTADEVEPEVSDNAKAKTAANALTDGQIVAARSADIDADTADEHVKVFVLPPGPKPSEANGYSHEANFAATRQYMIGQGLRPTGDVRLVSIKPFGPGGKSWALTYAVPAVPAERFNFAEVHVVTDNEDPDGDGTVNATQTPKTGDGKPAESDADELPTSKSTREQIDAYGASHGVDTSGAANKSDALALLTKPTA